MTMPVAAGGKGILADGGAKSAGARSVGITLDPRTKLALLIVIAVVVLAGAGGSAGSWARPLVAAIPLVLLMGSRRIWAAGFYAVLAGGSSVLTEVLLNRDQQTWIMFALLFCGIFARVLPGLVAGYYLLATTTVSEFVAAMHRLRVPDVVVIPLSVMFRFFPTVAEEAVAVQRAMRMRGIRARTGHPMQMLEYRMVPVLACTVRIGEELTASALTRGLGGSVPRTNVCRIGFGVTDALVLVLCAAATLGLVVSRWVP